MLLEMSAITKFSIAHIVDGLYPEKYWCPTRNVLCHQGATSCGALAPPLIYHKHLLYYKL